MNRPHAVRSAAVDLFRAAGPFAWRFAWGKLARDPVALDLLRLDCLSVGQGGALRLVDLGCGQGLLFAVLEAHLHRDGAGPRPPDRLPAIARAVGYDVSMGNVRRGQTMLRSRAAPRLAAEIRHADVRALDIPACDLAVLLDVLHYLRFEEQAQLIARIAAVLAPGGRLIVRVGDSGASAPARISRWVDRVVAGLRGQGWRDLAVRPIAQWRDLLAQQGFSVREITHYRSWSSDNVLLVADKTL